MKLKTHKLEQERTIEEARRVFLLIRSGAQKLLILN